MNQPTRWTVAVLLAVSALAGCGKAGAPAGTAAGTVTGAAAGTAPRSPGR